MKKIYTVFLFLFISCCITSLTYATLPTPVLTSPANNATNVPIPVVFQWNASAGATSYRVQLYIGINLVLDSVVASGLTDPNLIGQTTYRWRVKALSATDSSAFSGYFTFTTAVAAPPAPNLITPTNGESGVSITPLFQWSNVAGAQTYRMQLAFDQNFTNIHLDIPGLTSSQYQITASNPLTNNTLYYWRVNATNSGGTSPWSSTFNFVTILAPPPPPALLTPPNGGVNISLTPAMTWSAVAGATAFHIQIASDNTFLNTIVFDSTNIPGTSITIPAGVLGGPTTYYWRVSSINAGGEGTFANPFHFTTVTGPPPAPLLLSPPNNATCVNRFPLLDWQDAPGATSYRVQISSDPNFGTFILNAVVTPSQYQVIGNLLTNNTLYYWRSAAINTGGQGPFSTIWNFTTVPVTPTSPTLSSPANNSTGISLTPRLIWNHGANATTYRLQVSTTNTFNTGTIVVDQQNLVDTFYNINSGVLNGNQSYYWRVSSANCSATSGYSAVFHFTTLTTISLNLHVLLEGFYNGTTQVQDTIRIYLANSTGSHQKIDSAVAHLSTAGTDTSSFSHAPNGNYYIVINHRNHLETWSSLPVAMSSGNTVGYDFTTSSNKAYGNNMKQVGSVWVLYGGDINQDGTIDPDDYTLFKTQYGRDGYIPSDLNGDTFADGYDLLILYSNFFVSKITPP